MSKDKPVKKKPSKISVFAFFSILIFVLGLALAIVAATLPYFKQAENLQLRIILIYVGLGVLGVGIILIIVAIAIFRYYDKHPEKLQERNGRIITYQQPAPEVMPDAVAQLDNKDTNTGIGPSVQYIPSMEAYEFINMGKYQTLEEKFDQISKMDHTQFVIYVARLFSRKGYQVKLTPVVDNFDIDLIVEKMGVTIAVGCLLANKVLCKEDITCVREGKNHYHVNNCMALTNMYFDRTALEYAREEKMSLVDRNILAEDFMN